MDIEKKISSISRTVGGWLEEFRYIASIALNFLECFLYALVGIICLTYCEGSLDNVYCKYISCALVAMGIVDGLHKVPTTYIIKHSKPKKGSYKDKIIRWMRELRKFFIRNKLNVVIDFFGILMMFFAIMVMMLSMWNAGHSAISQRSARDISLGTLKSSSGLYNLLSLLYSLYNLVMQGYQYISGFKERGTYSNTSGIVIRFEDDEEEFHGIDKDPFSSMPMITVTEVVFMLIFIVWGFWSGGSDYIKKAFVFSTVIRKVVTSVLQYMAPFFRHSGSKNVILLPIIFISLLSLCSYIGGLNTNVAANNNPA
ncbi:hypothetical protein EHEL_081620 [Encephalitozoon hellem ATCC 50504]|uniref:Uncharacterized protein n=1 Tax=Encephalitozoon hellem TaxID=27973 RepID=A0A9Q9C781_ENCHE|nr:uncharacterized protein EHEL_081620 [Encephalitozoon hellem ATCC 50504]AFM98862.1 hypothetical protein EHEL_081620 [Encephalitozoon hellem ATCC 50504]UTX43842.1 hypothetical protein GPU96_08g16160 [Encephalitozoon hellem]|eukprot:XP_003887843.1 hypothetical protein EHEL_081620 [Encephalitozoon hellem ATCC 50504]